MHYPQAVILPPKIYHYEPKICGFKIAGKRGSKYFQPPRGNVHYIEDSVQGLELEGIKDRQAATQDDSNSLPVDFTKKLVVDGGSAAKAAAANSTGEDNEATVQGD